MSLTAPTQFPILTLPTTAITFVVALQQLGLKAAYS